MISLLGWAILHGAGTLIQVADIIRGSGLERMEESGKLICAVCEDNTGRNTVTQENRGSRNTKEERALLSN